jgi:hypothetical protein
MLKRRRRGVIQAADKNAENRGPRFQRAVQPASRQRAPATRTLPAMDSHRLLEPRAALLRLAATALAFALLYSGCNQLAHARGVALGAVVFDWEHAVPLLPWTIVPYLSIVGFFALSFLVDRTRASLDRFVTTLGINLGLSVPCWLLMPMGFAFDRPPIDGWTAPLFALLAATDLPYNRAPSLHIRVLVILVARFAPLLSGWARVALLGWFALIGVSVLTTWQHHLIDIAAGVAAGCLSLWLGRRWRIGSPWPSLPPTVSALIASSRPAGSCRSTTGR